jgi:pimeloyl-ACP methyl ester carboxylesterase
MVEATNHHPAVGPLRQVDAGLLNVGYAEAGPGDGRAVVLLHGWPYDIHSYVEVAPLLAAAGYRVVVPYLRGFGTTRFLSDARVRNGEQAALAVDVIALLDALDIERAILAGFDWGARTAAIVAALWPERCTRLVSVSGYLIGSQEAGKLPLPPAAELQWWYQYYFATERGRAGYDNYRRDFAKLIWRTASPKWTFDDATFDRSAAAFDNPDHVEIVIHNYRWRLGLADGEAAYAELERHRPQPSPGSPRSVRQRGPRGRRLLTSTPPHQGAVMPQATTDTAPLTVVLVHGAFADASSWSGVIERLQAAGIQVTAPANPLRGIATDSAYVASFLNQIPGPVLAVGHSYGGAVISNAATDAANVVGLVFVAAFAPDEGERLGEVESGSKDSVLMTALVPLQYPLGDGTQTAVEFAIDPAKFHDAFAADLPPEQAAVMAATQRPVAELAFSEPSGPPAWRSSPAWAVVATGDKAAGTDVVRSMAERARATITEAEGSHVIMVSQPGAVAEVIMTAAAAVGRPAAAAGG